MTPGFAARVPTLWHGRGVAPHVTTRLTEGRETLVIVDSAISVPALTARSAGTLEVEARSVTVADVVALARVIARRRPQVIVAVGGGTVLDAGKIAALALAPGRLFDFAIERASTSALTFLPDARPPVDIVAVPTTLGTSSETNSVGILKNDSGYRLIVGRSLRPRHAIIDSGHLATLTPAAVREGALEAFLRLAGASTSPRRTARGKSDAVALGSAILNLVGRDTASEASRLRLARLSAATQRSAALRGQDPYSARHWYVANEVAFVLEVRKVVATAAVVAAVWRRISSGDSRWGDRASLEQFWTEAAGGMALPLDPAAGIAALMDRWAIPLPPRPTAHDIDRIAVSTHASWGDRYPMLPGLVEEDFVDVLRDSRWSPQPVGHPGRLSTIYAERR
ncbi:daptide-type RiPP biosynthesis dehydogenase [Microbacterium sp. 3J1]|uniref:daptide-type RiPP biosynthesis dehydogenase n=1 Tax=Microbacterium sp. 3J1 TaxID=861269 RepID=UPI000A4CD171|nr:daptide-type RiPP biosynthesis dehydogenase [Microbacterium sp. 3J1]